MTFPLASDHASPLPDVDHARSSAVPSARPLVSVLIRSMDRASLSDALASVAAQTYPHVEIVLVNAKGEGHRDVGPQCGPFPIRLVGVGGRLGRSAAANLGLERALGAYLMFLDDDDLIDPEHIESLVNTLTQSPPVQAVFSGTRVIGADGATLGVYDHAFSSAQLLVGNFLPIHSVLFNRALVEAGCRFDTSLETYEDWDFWLQIAQRTDFAQTGTVSASYRSFLGDSGMAHKEHRALQRQRRSVIWHKWWSRWQAENADLLAGEMEATLDARDADNTALRTHLHREIDQNVQLHSDLAAAQMALCESVAQVSALGKTNAELNESLTQLAELAANRDAQISILHGRIDDILSSTSWKLTAPLRHAARQAQAVRRKIAALRLLVRSTWQFLRRGSLLEQAGRAYRFTKAEGWTGVKRLLARKASSAAPVLPSAPSHRPATAGLVASDLAMPDRSDFQTLASIDVSRYAYFFFDVFDTAIIRLFEKPVDIFQYMESTTPSRGFAERRVRQEHKARAANPRRRDIGLSNIYDGFRGESLQREIDTELKFCTAHPEILAFYTDLVSKGKKIYFVSDMYLDRETIRNILVKNGFTHFEDVFVSSEDDLIKGDGSRFDWLNKTLPESRGAAIHIGDNRVSDWVQPQKFGYAALQYRESIEFYHHDSFLFSKAAYLIDKNSLGISFMLGMFKFWKSGFLNQPPGYWKQFGFLYGGALVSAFCCFVNNRVSQAQLSTNRIFFLARDGDIMSKVYRLLHTEYEAVYLLASRRCMSFPSLHTLDSDEDRNTLKLFTTPIGVVGAGDLVDRFGYDDMQPLQQAFEGLASAGLLHSEPDILKCIVAHEESVLAKASAERETLLAYLDSIHFFDSSDVVIADVGWGGSIQNALVRLLNESGHSGKTLHGMYLGVGDHVQHEDRKSGYLFQGDKSRFADFLNLIELITSSPQSGVMRIARLGDRYEPVSAPAHADELNRQTIAADIQAGILDFAQIVKDKAIGNLDFFQPGDFEALFSALQSHPSQEDVEMIGGIKHAMTLGNHFGDSVLNKKD